MYDPYIERAWQRFHKSAMVLRRMDRNRDRKNVLVYRRNIEEYLTERGKEHRVGRFRRAFKLRRAAREA